jgi:hypothetical protein
MGGTAEDVFRATPIGAAVDAAQGNPTIYEEAFNPPSDPTPPPPPACSTYQSGTSESELVSFQVDQPTPGRACTNTLSIWLEQKRDIFCSDVNNFGKNPGGGTCIERNAGQALAKTYCGGSDRIKTAAACTRAYLGDDAWVLLATTYCQSDTGKADQWCSCFNVMNGVCDNDPNAAGCPEKALSYDPLVAATPQGFKGAWIGREGCYGLVCQEEAGSSKWILENANQNCASPIQICGPAINAENLTASTINSKCVIGGVTYDEDGNPMDRDGDPLPLDEDGNPIYPEEGFFTKYFPTSLTDFTGGDINKKIGPGALCGTSLMSCVCIVVLLLVMSSGGGKSGGPSRFRR